MSTRCHVGIKEGNKFKHIYVHFDGYPRGVGNTLRKHYATREKVEELISLGACSVLGSSLEPAKANFDDTHKINENGSLFYGRDRGEKDVEAEVSDWDEYLKEQMDDLWIEYIYVFEGGKWKGYEKNLYCPIMDKNPDVDEITDDDLKASITGIVEIPEEAYDL